VKESDQTRDESTVYSDRGKTDLVQLNLLKLAGYLTYHQVLHSIILHGDYRTFLCFVWLSEETVVLPYTSLAD